MKTTDYLKQATDFLEKTGATFKAEYLKTAKYFPNDKEERDIYQITLTRGPRSYSFQFGQSIVNSGFYYTKGVQKILIDRKEVTNKHLVQLIKKKDGYFLNNGKSGIIHYPKIPNEYDVLACLTKYDPDTFECFCDEFSYDTDSKKAEKTYNAAKDEYLNLCTLFSASEMEEMQEIQ